MTNLRLLQKREDGIDIVLFIFAISNVFFKPNSYDDIQMELFDVRGCRNKDRIAFFECDGECHNIPKIHSFRVSRRSDLYMIQIRILDKRYRIYQVWCLFSKRLSQWKSSFRDKKRRVSRISFEYFVCKIQNSLKGNCVELNK